MKISHAIELLTEMQKRHGDVEVVSDCPHCGKSTRPDYVVAVAALGSRDKEPAS